MLALDAKRSRLRGWPSRAPGKLLVGLLLVGWVFDVAAPAQAGSIARAKRYFRAAEKQFSAGQYEEAAKLYQKAYEQKALPALLINIGQCQRKLDRCEEANGSFRRYLAAQPEGPHAAKAQALIKACEEDLAASKLLEQQQQAPAATTDPTPPDPQPQPPPSSTESEGLSPLYFWSSVGLAGAMTLVGITTGALSLKKSSRYKDPATPAGELEGLRDSGQSLKTASNVTFGIGIGAAVAATVLYFFTDFGGSEERSGGAKAPVSAAVAPLGGGGLVTVGGTF